MPTILHQQNSISESDEWVDRSLDQLHKAALEILVLNIYYWLSNILPLTNVPSSNEDLKNTRQNQAYSSFILTLLRCSLLDPWRISKWVSGNIENGDDDEKITDDGSTETLWCSIETKEDEQAEEERNFYKGPSCVCVWLWDQKILL